MTETETESEPTMADLIDALDEIKHRWQQGDHLELPGPIERARHVASELEDAEDDSVPDGKEIHYREDCLPGSFTAHDIYPREEIKRRARDHAAERYAKIIDAHDIDPDDLEVRWATMEDGVVLYKLTHPDLPSIVHEHLPNSGRETKEVLVDALD